MVIPSTPAAPRLARTSPHALQSTSLRSGRREAPRAARLYKPDWRRFPPAPLSTGRWVLPSPAGSKRISATAFPGTARATGSPTSPLMSPRPRRVGTPPSPPHQGHDHDRRDASRRVIALLEHYARPFPRRRPHSPRGPLLERGYVVLAVIAHTASAANLKPSRRLPSRLYAGSSPYGRVLAGLQTFPALSHRSFPRCRRPYAGEPRGCSRPIASPRTLAFAKSSTARRSQTPQLALSTPQGELLVA